MSTQCTSCLASILWAFTEAGKRMPVDAAPTATATLVVEEETAAGAVLYRCRVEGVFDGDGPRYTSHFATCPHAGQHRKRKAGQRR